MESECRSESPFCLCTCADSLYDSRHRRILQAVNGKCRQPPCQRRPSYQLTSRSPALNVVIKYAPGLNFPTRKNNFYIPPENDSQRRILGGGLEVYQAFFTSVRPAIGTMIMNLDRGAGAFKMSGSSIEVLKAYLGRRDPRDLELARMPPRFQVKTKRFLKNLTVALKFARDPNAK